MSQQRAFYRSAQFRKRVVLLPLVLALVLVGGLGVSAPARSQAFPEGSVSSSTLPNGLRVVLKRTPGAPLVGIGLWVKAGSRNETPENNGVAHLLEHYLFGGESSGTTDPFDRLMEGIGGSLNAETTRDNTHYYVTVPRSSFERAMKSLAAMLLQPTLSDARLETERRRAADEVQQRAQDPVRAAREAAFALAYKVSPYRLPIAGTPENVERLNLDQIRSFYHTYYRPDNASLILAGDITLPQALAAAQQAFGAWARPDGDIPAVPVDAARPLTPTARLIPLRGPSQTALLMVGFPAPSVQTPHDTVVMDVIYALLTSGSHSLASRQLEKPELMTGLSSDFLTSRDPGMFLLWGYVPVVRVAQVRQKLADVVQEVSAGAFSDEDLLRARGLLLGSYALENETTADSSTSLGFYDAIYRYTYAVEYEREVQSVTRDDLMRVAREYFKSNYTIVIAPPGTAVG